MAFFTSPGRDYTGSLEKNPNPAKKHDRQGKSMYNNRGLYTAFLRNMEKGMELD
jgi:hypothetical protein